MNASIEQTIISLTLVAVTFIYLYMRSEKRAKIKEEKFNKILKTKEQIIERSNEKSEYWRLRYLVNDKLTPSLLDDFIHVLVHSEKTLESQATIVTTITKYVDDYYTTHKKYPPEYKQLLGIVLLYKELDIPGTMDRLLRLREALATAIVESNQPAENV